MLAIYFWKTGLQPRLPRDSDLELPYVALENACVDSSLVALRAFEDFVTAHRSKPDDLIATDFPGLAITSPGIGLDQRTKINKHIAHLTHLDLEDELHCYSYRDCLDAVMAAAIAFCDHVVEKISDDHGLHQFAVGTKEVCVAVRDNYVNRT
jgi:hypothetical protein